MATQAQLMAEALALEKQATIHPDEWCLRIKNGYKGKPYNYKNTKNYPAQVKLWQAANTNPSPAPGIDLRDVQRCLFLVDDISRVFDTHDRLLIATADLTYRHYYTSEFLTGAISSGRFRVWCDCHSTFPQTALQWLDDLGLPHNFFYGECESAPAFDVGYSGGARRMVGNMSVLHPNAVDDPRHDQLDKVNSGEVLITNETYFNRDPNYGVDWRSSDGVGSNTLACYASSSEPATYYPFDKQHEDGKANPATDCYYMTGLDKRDWDYIVAT